MVCLVLVADLPRDQSETLTETGSSRGFYGLFCRGATDPAPFTFGTV